MKGFWTCQRVAGGVKCSQRNANRKRKCERCGKPKRDRSSEKPAHLSALALSYEYYAELNGGEFCGICGAAPKSGRRLNRDHCHKGVGTPRGLLCWDCNKWLRDFMTADWLRAAAAYLERSAR